MATAQQELNTAIKMLAEGLHKREMAHKVDSKGRKVRVTSKEDQVSRADIRDLLWQKRVVTEEEVLEFWGPNMLRYAVSAKWLIRDKGDLELFWVTDKVAVRYDLPNTLCTGYKFDFVKA